jgi:hypothetical protein
MGILFLGTFLWGGDVLVRNYENFKLDGKVPFHLGQFLVYSLSLNATYARIPKDT